jgi:hypothetical protein
VLAVAAPGGAAGSAAGDWKADSAEALLNESRMEGSALPAQGAARGAEGEYKCAYPIGKIDSLWQLVPNGGLKITG